MLTAPPSIAAAHQQLAAPAEHKTQDFALAVMPYLWAAGVSGEASLGNGPSAGTEVDFADLLDNLEGAVMLAAEARIGRDLGLLGDVTWLALEKDGTATALAVPVRGDIEMIHAQLSGVWRPPGQKDVFFDVLAGVRVIDLELEFQGGGPFAVRSSASTTLVDPVIGLRAVVPIGDSFQFLAHGDVGGFGAGSDLSYQFLASFGWSISRTVGIGLGWRHLGVDYSDQDLAVNFDFSGPLLGMRIAF